MLACILGDHSLLDEKPLFPDGRSTSTPYTSDVEHSEKQATGEPYATSPEQDDRKEDTGKQ